MGLFSRVFVVLPNFPTCRGVHRLNPHLFTRAKHRMKITVKITSTLSLRGAVENILTTPVYREHDVFHYTRVTELCELPGGGGWGGVLGQ